MNNVFVGMGSTCRMLALVLVMTTALTSCRHTTPSHDVLDPQHARLDSVYGTMRNADTLAALAVQAHEQGDGMSELLALMHQGRVLREQSRTEEAINAYHHSLRIAAELGDTIDMVNAYSGLGLVYRRLGDLSKATDHLYQALRLSDCYSVKDSDRALKARAIVLSSIGNIEIEMYNFTFADSILRLALATDERRGNHLGMAINCRNLGIIKRFTNSHDSAWAYLDKSMEYSKLSGSRKAEALCHLHYGDLHVEQRAFSHAIEEYKIAYNELKDQNDSWNWIDASLALTRVYILMGEEDLAHEYLQEAEAEAQRIVSKDYLAEASMLHYELSLMQGRPQEALQYYIRGTELMDSIHGFVPESDDMLNHHIDYERGRKSGEVDVLNKDISKLKRTRNLQFIFTFVMLLMAAAVIGALAYANRVRRRTQRLMRQVEETRSLFFTNVVHQLRTPLTAIMGSIDSMLERGRIQPPGYREYQRQDAIVIERQGKNLLTLVDRILEVGSVRSAIKKPDWRCGDAVIFIRMVVERYRDMGAARHIEISYTPQEPSVEIVIVPQYLATIVGNLLENAINYCNEYGKIHVTTSVEGNQFTIVVADDGMGINKKDLPHVFEPFYRGASAEQLVEGIGIGLTVVRDMTMAMGGTVDVDSVKAQGAVFTVVLPCKHGGVKERFENVLPVLRNLPERKTQPDLAELRQEDVADKPVALVVEDQNDVARLVGHVLDEHCTVHYATDGEQGLAKACDLLPDLIVTDVKMPLMDGLEMCRSLRKNEQLCHIPVIMLSARTSDADRIRGIEAGADAYLLKPFVREELVAWVKHLLERGFQDNRNVADDSTQDARPVVLSTTETADDDQFLRDFMLEIDKQFSTGNKIDYDAIALKFKMGETQMRRKIQALTGKNVPAYITQLRMEKAMRLLRECPDSLIGNIAEQCGFQDVAYFSRVFRQYYGMTPTQARNK